jgi:hypothetical protein
MAPKLTDSLRLPDSVSDAPKCSQNEIEVTVLRMRYPIEENSDDNEVKACSDDEDGNTANNSGESAKKQ